MSWYTGLPGGGFNLVGNRILNFYYKNALFVLRPTGVRTLKTSIYNSKIDHIANGNTNTVYSNPINSLKFVLNTIRKDKIKMNKNFYVFTGSTVGVVPIKGKGFYSGNIDKLGSVKVRIT